MKRFQGFARQKCGTITIEMIALVCFIGLLDFVTGYEVSFFLLYGAPIFAVAWFCDHKHALLTALIAGIIWWWADLQGGHPYPSNWIQVWENGMRLGFFLFVAWAGSQLRAQADTKEARIALLERSQKLEQEIVNTSEEERRRIGQDLHDGLCQYLAALGCAAASLTQDLQKAQRPVEAATAAELARLLEEAVVQTRDLARGLVPVHLDQAGLAVALQGLAHSVSRLQGINCTFVGNLSVPCPEPAAMHLYRIAQEAINNAAKHGHSRNIAITLDSDDRATTLRVTDDGPGISNTRTPHGGRGMGLNIMQYRARQTGGELTIEEPKSGGTIISCVAPATS